MFLAVKLQINLIGFHELGITTSSVGFLNNKSMFKLERVTNSSQNMIKNEINIQV